MKGFGKKMTLLLAVLVAAGTAGAVGSAVPARAAATVNTATGHSLTLDGLDVKMGGDYGLGAYYALDIDAENLFYLVNNKAHRGDITLQYRLTSEARSSGGGQVFGSTRMYRHLKQDEGYNAWGVAHVGIVDYNYNGGTGTYGKNTTFFYDSELHERSYLQEGQAAQKSGNVLAEGDMKAIKTKYDDNDTSNGAAGVPAGKEYSIYSYLDLVQNAPYFGIATTGGTYSASGKYWCFDENNNALGLAYLEGTGQPALTVFDQVRADAGATVCVQVTTPEGHTFSGIRDKTTGETMDVGTDLTDEGNGVYSFTMPDKDVSLEAVYTANEHSITVTGENSDWVSVPSAARFGETVTVTFTPDEGWHAKSITVNGSETAVDQTDTEFRFDMGDADVVISVAFERAEGVFFTQIGLVVTPAETKDKWYYGDSYSFTVAAETGYVLGAGEIRFNGTAVQPDANGVYTVSLVAENRITASALAPLTYTVTFDTAGGSAVASAKVDYSAKAVRPDDPTREGYRFVGWYVGDRAYDFDDIVTEDVTLTAVWEKVAGDSGCGKSSAATAAGTVASLLIAAAAVAVRGKR